MVPTLLRSWAKLAGRSGTVAPAVAEDVGNAEDVVGAAAAATPASEPVSQGFALGADMCGYALCVMESLGQVRVRTGMMEIV